MTLSDRIRIIQNKFSRDIYNSDSDAYEHFIWKTKKTVNCKSCYKSTINVVRWLITQIVDLRNNKIKYTDNLYCYFTVFYV